MTQAPKKTESSSTTQQPQALTPERLADELEQLATSADTGVPQYTDWILKRFPDLLAVLRSLAHLTALPRDEEVAAAIEKLESERFQYSGPQPDQLRSVAALIRRLHSSLAERTREVEEAWESAAKCCDHMAINAQRRAMGYDPDTESGRKARAAAVDKAEAAQLCAMEIRALSHKAPGK